MPVKICLIPDCDNAQRCRGLCANHEARAREAMKAGRVTESELMERGLLLKTRKTKTSSSSDPFTAGSNIRGDQ